MAAEAPPGTTRDPALHLRLERAYAAKGADYRPRTHLLTGDGRARFVNRLIEEASPYLQQHAHNAVDWHPWSAGTLAGAREFGRPIFLSAGYATCHWCHVMEEESFDDVEVAALLNRHFLPVKIDREAMPALDHIYITATEIQQGHAGWPNSVFLMPDGRPFHTATYIPRPEFMQILATIGAAWADPARRAEIDKVATALSGAVRRVTTLAGAASVPLDAAVMNRAAADILKAHNPLEGGFSQTQQFPQEGMLLFLLDHWRRTGDKKSIGAVTRTLTSIAAGGIHDHAGGGFHRYAVDPNWRTPHFEKMLYNQGLLARAFIEAWEITADPAFRRAAERTFAYVARDMTDAEGAFYAAEDADSPDGAGKHEEGVFYVWTPDQIAEAAGHAAVAALRIDQAPTVESGAVIHLDPDAKPDFSTLDPMLESVRKAREQRPRPVRDEKVIAGWNGLMIRALADGAAALGNVDLGARAARAGETVWRRLWKDDRLRRLWAGRQARQEGVHEDYAWLGLGFLALWDATGEAVWHRRARKLGDAIWNRFHDGNGRLRMSDSDGPLGPVYDSSDGALPSGESSALELLARLAGRSTDPEAGARARALRAALSGPLARQPLLRPDALRASRILDEGESGARQVAAGGQVALHLAGRRLRIRIAPGWHLNANRPGQDGLIGVALEGAGIEWPAGRAVDLGFADRPVRIYEGTLDLALQPSAPVLRLRLQACSDRICLEPETVTFRLP